MNIRKNKRLDLLENLATAVVLIDEHYRVDYLNPAAEVLFRVSTRQTNGQDIRKVVPGFAKLTDAIDRAVAQGATYTERETQIAAGPEHYITVECSVTPMENGRILLELTALDRHLRISKEHRLIAQNRAIRELIRGLAHEIKNPLGGIRGSAQLLDRELDHDELREYTQVIISEADRLQALVNGLLGPDAQPEKRLVNIHQILERVRHLVQAEAPKGVQISRDYDPSIPDIQVAPDQLIQAVLNIVRNAMQAVGKDGRILLRTRTQRLFTIGNITHKLVARIDIVDNGPGIAPEFQDQIFYPMVTTRAQGSGIGLSIAQTLVSQHGGLVECSSQPGNTTFTISLPLEERDE
ncbi:nitrogen regulation protein NR(II) [Ectothiorhodospiraceae bacterium WFHF3C12]|nr:nitrogen regulation protein NR(II) [Ectothiorhodospiraceae bacterium WFHF3C12]